MQEAQRVCLFVGNPATELVLPVMNVQTYVHKAILWILSSAAVRSF